MTVFGQPCGWASGVSPCENFLCQDVGWFETLVSFSRLCQLCCQTVASLRHPNRLPWTIYPGCQVKTTLLKHVGHCVCVDLVGMAGLTKYFNTASKKIDISRNVMLLTIVGMPGYILVSCPAPFEVHRRLRVWRGRGRSASKTLPCGLLLIMRMANQRQLFLRCMS